MAELSVIYRARSRRHTERAFRQSKLAWKERRPKNVACIERGLACLLNPFAVPESHWKKVRTTKVIERAFREVRRRTRPMTSLNNLASCDRIIIRVVRQLNCLWERKPLREFTQSC